MLGLQSRITNVLLATVLLALLGIIGMLASGVRGGPLDPTGPPGSTPGVRLPGTPVSGPTTITQPGHYYLTNNISVSGAVNAIVISASNVSFDLGGFTVDGNDTGGTTGIIVTSGNNDVSIVNGTVQDFHVGINVNSAQRSRVEAVNTVSNIRGMEIGTFSLVVGCMSSSNTEWGIVVLGNDSVVRDCLVLNNDVGGVFVLAPNNLIERLKIRTTVVDAMDIQTAPAATLTTIRQNVVTYIRLESLSNTLVNNLCAFGGEIRILGMQFNSIPPETGPHGNWNCAVVFNA